MTVLYASADVRHQLIDGLVILLDIRVGDYVILDEVASAMWQAQLYIKDYQERITSLEQQFDAPADRLEADLTEFLRNSIERGYLQHEPPTCLMPSPLTRIHNTLLAFWAWWSLFSTTRALAQSGFAPLYKSYIGLGKPDLSDADMRAMTERAERAFTLAENFFVIPTAPKDCLPRSLALYRFLLSCGIPAEHVIGARRHPFRAHAWVECRGRVLGDSPDFVSTYTELARL